MDVVTAAGPYDITAYCAYLFTFTMISGDLVASSYLHGKVIYVAVFKKVKYRNADLAVVVL